jgi:hypothetical protein
MASAESVFNHLVLPPRLPGREDADTESIGNSIVTGLLKACTTLRETAGHGTAEVWDSLHRSFGIFSRINKGCLERTSILREFRNLRHDDILVLYVVEQNAALLIRHKAG